MNISTVNELITSLESAGELSIKERKYLELAKAYLQLAAENVGLLNFITTRCYVFEGTWTGDMSDYYLPAEEVMPETHATDAAMAGIKADGVEEFAKKLESRGRHQDYVEIANAFAKQLRAGTDK